MKCIHWIARAFVVSAIVFGTASAAFAQQEALENISAVVDVTTGSCSGSGCKSGDCNNGAGPQPANVNISATVSLCQVAGVLRGIGSGRGFEFGKTYISLLYKNPNTGTCSRAPNELTPLPLASAADPRVDSDFASMMLGIWVVKPDGSATLVVNKQAPVAGLQNYRTVSVREVQVPNVACYRADLDPAPQLNALRACGLISFGAPCLSTNVCETLCIPKIEFCPVIDDGVCRPIP